jgi:hypothetical protein
MEKLATPAIPAFDLETLPVPGQVAFAVLDLQGSVVVRSGNTQLLSEQDAPILFEMFSQSAQIDPNIQRLSVKLSGYRYTVTRDENHIYIVQTRNES